MKTSAFTAHQRINITLPADTIRLVGRVAAKGDRSRLIAEAIRQYVGKSDRTELQKRLREGAIKRRERDLGIVRDWFSIDEEVWHRRGK